MLWWPTCSNIYRKILMAEPRPILFDESTRRKLEQLMLVAAKVRSGAIKGERRSNKRGTSIEFADYRNYTPGDDLRRVDWNVYARLERPLTKMFEDEEDLAVYILLDTSASMDWGGQIEGVADAPELNKFDYMRRLAAGMAYISLSTNDRLLMSELGKKSVFGPARGRGYGPRLLTYINQLQADGRVGLNQAMKDMAVQIRRGGLCILLSDLFSPDGYIEGINALASKGCEIVVIQLLSPDEISPSMVGDLRFLDSETGEAQEVSLDPAMRDLYHKRVNEWRDEIRRELQKRGAHFLSVSTEQPWEKVILQDLRRLGVLL